MSRSSIFSIVLCIVTLTAVWPNTVRATHETTFIADSAQPELVRTDGRLVAWTEFVAPGVYELLIHDRATGESETLTSGNIPVFDISGDIVIWLEWGGLDQDVLRGKNLVSGAEFVIAEDHQIGWSGLMMPRIEGDWVVWQSAAETSRNLARNVATMEEPLVLIEGPGEFSSRTGYSAPFGFPLISDGRVMWLADSGAALSTISRFDLGTGEQIDDLSLTIPGFHLSLAGDLLTYADQTTIMAVNLETGEIREIANDARPGPVTDGRFVFWQELRTDDHEGTQINYLLAYDFAEHAYIPVALSSTVGTQAVQVDARDGLVVWSGVNALDTGLIAEHPNWEYFPLTDHWAKFGILNFWRENGGIPVFGYPLTEQRGNHQYFERQRLEEHPQHLGTPYDVQLGLLGTEDAERRGLLDNEAFQPLPQETASDEHCMFFAETGHRLCHGFRDYWRSYGLDFGDPGISFRESVALFGYPISEEFFDSELGLTVQYFQRARFEFHLDNPEPYRVLLARLGADQIYGDSQQD